MTWIQKDKSTLARKNGDEKALQIECSKHAFPGSSGGEESICNAGDSGLIPELGRPTGEGVGSPLQYSWASLVIQWQWIHLPCGRPGFDPWVGKIPWRRESTHSSIIAWRIPWTEKPGRLQPMESQRVTHDWATFISLETCKNVWGWK